MREAYRARILDSRVGLLAQGNISWGDRPPGGTLPAIVLKLISPGREYDHDGFDGLSRPRIQADFWAATFLETVEIGDAYIALIEQPATRDGILFGSGFLDSDIDLPPPVSGASNDPRGEAYRRSIDMMISWETM